MITYIIIGAISIIILFYILINNQIVEKTNRVAQSYGSIEIYLKKRFDLIPNLISLLKKYTEHEKEIFFKVTELRTKVADNTDANDKIKNSNELSGLMSKLNLNVENYPEIKADKQFQDLQFELSDLEDQISASRRAYNASVTGYNNKIQKFPASLVANIRNDKTKLLLEIPVQEQQNVNIGALFN